jgi:hypothetical protein
MLERSSPTGERPPAPNREDDRSLTSPILAAVLATIALRALVALSRIDELELERYGGSLAWALIHGVPLDGGALPIIPHLRGSAVFGLLCVPLLWLFGPTLGAVKALAVAWSALGAGSVTLVAGRALGRRAAWVAGLGLALAPPSFQMVDVLALGSHADTLPLIAVPLALILSDRYTPQGGTTSRGYLAIGAALGLGFFFSMQLIVAAPALLLAWWARDPRFFLRTRIALSAAAAAPALAMIPVLTRSATLVNKPLEERFAEGGLAGSLLKFLRGLSHDLPASWLFGAQGLPAATVAVGLVLLLCTGLVLGAVLRSRPWRGERRTAGEALRLFALGHLVLLMGAYAVSDFEVNLGASGDGMGSRYFMPLLPALLWLLADGLQLLGDRRPRLAHGCLAACAISGAAGTWSLVDLEVARRQPPVLATEFSQFEAHLAAREDTDPLSQLELLDRIEPDWGEFRALAHVGAFRPPGRLLGGKLRSAVAATLTQPPRLRPFTLAALGAAATGEALLPYQGRFASELPLDWEGPLTEQLQEVHTITTAQLDDAALRWFLRGVGRRLSTLQGSAVITAFNRGHAPPEATARAVFRALARLPPEASAALVEGLGFQFGLRLTRYERGARTTLEAIDELPDAQRARWLVALGWGFRMRFVEADFDPGGHFSIAELFKDADWAFVATGLQWSAESPDRAPDGRFLPSTRR